jgi:hypothetical protein
MATIHVSAERTNTSKRWYAESRFYKALAYLEQANWDDAYEAMDHIAPNLDQDMELDYLVWSADKRTLNVRLPAAEARRVGVDVFNRFTVKSRKGGQRDPRAVAGILSSLQSALQQAKLPRRR